MTRPLILTGWTGEDWREMAEITIPLMRAYASRHGFDFAWANLSGPRPPSWQKVIGLKQTLPDRPAVVWLDADVVIEDGTKNILAEVPESCDQALVEHVTECGLVPNCGVWVVRPRMLDTLAQLWDCNRHIVHCWWEQAVMLELLGYVVDGPSARLDAPTKLYQRTWWLGPQWNDHPKDQARSDHVLFRHATQYQNRLEAVRHFASHATWAS